MVTETRDLPAAATGLIPAHVAVIMDGNGRWAQRRHLPRLAGHRAGVRNIHRVARACQEIGVKTLTVYAFSTENWGRPADEVSGLMSIFAEAMDRETRNLHRNGVKLQHVGSMIGVAPHLRRATERATQLTQHNTGLTLNIAFNYGGRAEIVDALKRIVADEVPAEEIDEHLVERYLYTADSPDPDLVVRTAGEMRLSNFLIWQAAYSEYYATECFWPDFGRDELRAAVEAYACRKRKFGKL
ncbi:MAG: polyprenyl diphosphate synthase [Chloroflexota bacterium]